MKEVPKEIVVEKQVVVPATVESVSVPVPAKVGIVEDTLNVGIQTLGPIQGVGDPKELSPNNGSGIANMTIFETPVYSALDGDLLPRLFSGWETSEDGLSWIFSLEKGVFFHDGYGEFTADDAFWSMMRAVEEGAKYGGAKPLKRLVLPPNEVEVVDSYTIKITTEKPQFDALNKFRSPSSSGLAMQSQAAFNDGKVDEPKGTGPWKFVRARTAEFWEMEAVEGHWRKTPFFRTLKVIEIPEESVRVGALESGTLDTGLIAQQSLERLTQVDGFKFNTATEAGQQQWHFYGNYYSKEWPGFTPAKPWVSSNSDINSPEWDTARKVRLAMAVAIDRDLLVAEILDGYGRAQYYQGDAGNAILAPLREKNPKPFAYDPDRSKALLAEAGYPDGFDLDVGCYTRGLTSDVQMCEAVAGMWEAIGIKTSISKEGYKSLRPLIKGRDMKILAPHSLSTYTEPMLNWPNFISSNAGWNSGFEHPVLDEMIERAINEVDPNVRHDISRDISKFMVDQVTHIPVYVPSVVYPVGPKIDIWPLLGGDKRFIHNLEHVPPRK